MKQAEAPGHDDIRRDGGRQGRGSRHPRRTACAKATGIETAATNPRRLASAISTATDHPLSRPQSTSRIAVELGRPRIIPLARGPIRRPRIRSPWITATSVMHFTMNSQIMVARFRSGSDDHPGAAPLRSGSDRERAASFVPSGQGVALGADHRGQGATEERPDLTVEAGRRLAVVVGRRGRMLMPIGSYPPGAA